MSNLEKAKEIVKEHYLVIKISEEEYMLIKQKMQLDLGGVPSEAERIIANGTPLPKGHGRLIDADALIHWHRFESKSDYDIANAPTIIEADK